MIESLLLSLSDHSFSSPLCLEEADEASSSSLVRREEERPREEIKEEKEKHATPKSILTNHPPMG